MEGQDLSVGLAPTLGGAASGIVTYGPLTVDLVGGFVEVNNTLIELQPLQLRILGLLVLHAGSVVPKSVLRDRIFRAQQTAHSTSISRQVSVLRARLGVAKSLLTTVPGVGYGIGLSLGGRGDALAGTTGHNSERRTE